MFLDLPVLAIDTHCHLIPGVDDGSRTRAETLLMAEGLVRVGVERVHVTPHQFRFGNDLDPEEVRRWTRELAGWFAQAGLPLEALPGAEYLYGERLWDAIENREELLTWEPEGGTHPRRRMLVELPLREPVVGVTRLAERLLPLGIRPVMAHPERVAAVQQQPSRLDAWVEAGWEFQLDLLSLVTSYGRSAKRLARALLAEDRYRFTGSDLHRPVQLRDLEAARSTFLRIRSDEK